MQYFLIDKLDEEKPKKLNKKEVLNLMQHCYNNSENVLAAVQAETENQRIIGLRTYNIEIRK